ncbi:MAG: hypothetical protein U5J64_01305 [Halobacteriales archaeon]|nr:hypothetical protein [Halobacteriales archaeon]
MRCETTMKRDDDTAVSVLIGYIINIGIATIVVSLTLLLLQGAFTDVRDRAVESEMEAVGESFAGEIERVDILSQRGSSGVSTTVKVPQSETPYRMTVLYGSDEGARLLLEARSASVEVPFKNETVIEGAGDGIGVSAGSTPEITYDSTAGVIRIE